MILCVAPSPAVDRLLRIEGPLCPGAIHRPLEVVATPGGKGLNVARIAAALGSDVGVVAPLGGAVGSWIAEHLRAEGVEVESVPIRADPRTCVSIAAEGQGLTEFYEPAAALDEEEWLAFERAVARRARSAEWVTLSGSLPPGAPPDGLGRLVRRAHEAGAAVALDSHGATLRAGLAEHPELVKVNRDEAGELGVDVTSLRALAGGAGHSAVVTNGSGLVQAVSEDGTLFEAAPPVFGDYPVGCGDAVFAALAVARVEGLPDSEALALAIATGAAAAEVPGSGCVDAHRARELRSRVTVTRTTYDSA